VSRLHRRIMAAGQGMPAAMGDYHPVGTPDTPMVMPLSLVSRTDAGLTVQDMTPLITADGAMIPATAPGSWGQVHAAGRG
jgi:hypothetical protein